MIIFTVSFQHKYTDDMVFEVIDNIINPDKTNKIDYQCEFTGEKMSTSRQYKITFRSKLTRIELEIAVMQIIKRRTIFDFNEIMFIDEH